jgi:hypothetical protein
VITCNRCGNVAPAGAVHCQRCGAPLSSKVENSYGPRMGTQGQSGQTELPAWLESLRAGERPAAPSKSPSSFSASDLIEEGSLPSWMRPEQAGGNPNKPTGPQSTLRSSSLPEPNTDEGMAGAKGFTARSLIDEQSLPSWMKEGSDNSSGASPEMSGPNGIAASSLVQPDVLPDWMKNLQQPPTTRARSSEPLSSGPLASGPLASGYGSSSGAFASGALAAQQGQVQQPQRPMPPAPPVPPTASPLPPVQPMQATRPEPISAPQGFSARDLIDQNALPSWMTPQGGAETGAAGPDSPMNAMANGTQSVQGGPPPAGQNGFSASSLLDMDSLPPWLRESGLQQNTGGASRETQSGSLAMPPMQQNMPMQASPMNNAQGQTGSGIAASSFIDMNALPDWLRSGIEPQQGRAQQPQQGAMGTARPGAYGGPQRVENMRVPSRPRGEVNQAEGNEVAANVFASMLGVASAAPNFPASSPMPSAPLGSPMPFTPQAASAQPVPPPPSQPSVSPMMSGPLGGPMPQQGMAPGANNMIGMAQPGMGNPQSPQGYLGVYGGAYPANQNNQNNYAMGNPPMGSPQIPASGPGMAQMPGAAGQANGDPSGAKPARRGGLFNAIREWLFR